MEIPAPTLHNVLFDETCQRSIIKRFCDHMKSIGYYTCPPLLGEEPQEKATKSSGHQTSSSFLSSDRSSELNIDFLDFGALAHKVETHKFLLEP